jgi:excisionase family DNA binding protein
MTWKDLIIYVLENNLENEEVFKDGKVAGFMTVEEAAEKFGVGTETVRIWIHFNHLPAITLGMVSYIPFNAVPMAMRVTAEDDPITEWTQRR